MNVIPLRLTLFLTLFLTTSSAFAIVNLDALHFDNSRTGSSGNVSLGLSGSSGNSEKSQINLDGQYKYSVKRYSNIILANYQRGESNNTVDTNKRFLHLRHIHASSIENISWELYFQSESNQFTRLSLRSLLGTGIRYELNNKSSIRHFIGAGGFYSRETLEGSGDTTNSTRANIYLLSRISISDTATLNNTLYYQPDITSASDFRVFNVTTLNVKVVKQLSLKMSMQITHDSEPPATIEYTDINYTTAFVYSF